MTTASISMRGFGRTYGATVALAGVDLGLEPGVIGLLGPNGAGKTALIRLRATALPPTGGTGRVLGRDPAVPAQRTGIRRRLGYLPQEAGFPRGFTASAFIDYVALLKERAEPAARHADVTAVVWTGLLVGCLAWLLIPLWVLALGRALAPSRTVLPNPETAAQALQAASARRKEARS